MGARIRYYGEPADGPEPSEPDEREARLRRIAAVYPAAAAEARLADAPDTIRGKMQEAGAMRAQAHRLMDRARELEQAAIAQAREDGNDAM